MILQAVYANAEEIPEAYRALYAEDGSGAWRLSEVEGICAESELDRLQSELRSRTSEKEELENVFQKAGISPAELENCSAELESLHRQLDEANTKLNRNIVEKALVKAAVEHSIRREALPDVLLRGADFTVDPEGKVVLNGKTPDEWLNEIIPAAPHWIEPSRSGGVRSFKSSMRPPVSEEKSISELVNHSWNNKKG